MSIKVRCEFCNKEVVIPDDFSGDSFRMYLIPEVDRRLGTVDSTVCSCKECAELFDKVSRQFSD